MTNRNAILSRRSARLRCRFITLLVIVSVSVCCCKARFLAAGFGAEQHCGTIAAQTVPGCCSHAPSDDSDRRDDEDTSPKTPAGGCTLCCIKATNLDHGDDALLKCLSSTSNAQVLWTVPAPQAAVEHVRQSGMAEADGPAVPSPTLLRLHCALIV
jgi:hypothetical protein